MQGNTYDFPIQLDAMPNEMVERRALLERNEPESLTPPRLPVDHDRRVHHGSVLREVLFQNLCSNCRSETADEDLLRPLVLESGDCPLGIDLDLPIS